MYLKNTIRYWHKHKSMYASMVITIIFGIMAVMIAAFLVRSQVVTQLEETLNNGGFYDLAIYDIPKEVKEELKKDNRFETVGIVSVVGQAVSENGIEFPIGMVENKETEDMLHLTPVEGRYPDKSGEIALDRITMQCMGIKPKAGGVIRLQLKSKDKELETREYTVVGIIEQRYMANLGDIYTRRKYEAMGAEEGMENYRECPYGYIHSSEMDIFQKAEQEVLFACVKTGQDFTDGKLCLELLSEYGRDLKMDGNASTRADFADVLLGYSDKNEGWWGGQGYQAALERIGTNSTKKDFYSRVLIPIFSLCIAIITFFSLFEAFGSFILSRKKEIGMYRCLGMNQGQVLIKTLMELLCVILPGIFLGCVGGILGYGGILYVVNHILDLRIQQAFTLSDYFAPFIKAATVSPYTSAIGLSLSAILFSIVIPLIKCAGLSPIEVCRKEGASQKERIKYRVALGINVSLLMVAITVGYLYFVSERRFENGQLAQEAEEYLIDGSDYMMEKSFPRAEQIYELRHDAGISKENMKQLEESPMVEKIHKATVCNNTHLIYNQKEIPAEIAEYLEPAILEHVVDEDAPEEVEQWYKMRFERDKAYKGFKKEEDIYWIPTVALDEPEWSGLADYVVDGEIHQDALMKGEEVVLVYTGEEPPPYQVGDELPMNTVIYPKHVDESVEYNLTDAIKGEEPTYPGNENQEGQYCYGKRKDWKVKVGAILFLDNPNLSGFFRGESYFELQIFTRTEALKVWGMPDKNYTKAAVKLSRNADIGEFETLWYQLLSKGKTMEMKSLERVKDKIRENTWISRVIFLSMSGMMIIISLLGILNALRMQVLQEKRRTSIYRALGASKGEMRRRLQRKQLLMVVIGGVLAEGATIGIFLLRSHLNKKIDAYWKGTIELDLNWWGFDFPFSRIGQNDCMAAVIISLLMFLLMAFVIGYVYQRTINRQTIAEGLREE